MMKYGKIEDIWHWEWGRNNGAGPNFGSTEQAENALS